MVVSALVDACVLYPVGLRDTLLNVAEAGLYRVLWTEEILAETTRNIVDDTPELTAEHLDITFIAMRRAFPEAMIRDYEHLVDSMTNDPKDGHAPRRGSRRPRRRRRGEQPAPLPARSL
jgi:hypothetical protein